MAALAIPPMLQPVHQVEARGPVDLQLVPVEQVRDQRVVAVGGKLVRHQLRVLPDPDHVRQEQDRGVFVHCLACGCGDVGGDGADFDGFAGWFAAGDLLVYTSIEEHVIVGKVEGNTYSCLTPTVQH